MNLCVSQTNKYDAFCGCTNPSEFYSCVSCIYFRILSGLENGVIFERSALISMDLSVDSDDCPVEYDSFPNTNIYRGFGMSIKEIAFTVAGILSPEHLRHGPFVA